MAHVYRNIFIHGLGNVLGDRFVYRNTRSGKTIIARKPSFDDNRMYGETQRTHLSAMLEATTYASFAKVHDVYLNRELATGIVAYTIALADWFAGPKVLQIDVDAWTGAPGERIRVKARDNVAVAAVSVVIRDAQGNVLETGDAMQAETGGAWWIYTTQSRLKMTPFPSVEAIARDLPGNEDSFVIS